MRRKIIIILIDRNVDTDKRKDNSINEESIKIRTRLFKKYVLPHQNLIFKLCIKYSYSSSEVEDYYNELLLNFFKYIDTYNPNRSIQTWLHIVTKRFVTTMNLKKQNFKRNEDVDVNKISDTALDEDTISGNMMDIDNYQDFYNDDILEALEQIKPIYREALLLQQAGYKLNEIMEISYKNGNLKTKNIETVKSRLFLAKLQMRNLIDRNGNARID